MNKRYCDSCLAGDFNLSFGQPFCNHITPKIFGAEAREFDDVSDELLY